MSSENQVTLVGNITDDPELRYTPSGAAVANFTVAVNRRFKGQDGNWEDKLEGFFRCNCWRDMAENVTESLRKGARVHGRRPAPAAFVGDGPGPEAVRDRGPGRRGRPVAPVGDRAGSEVQPFRRSVRRWSAAAGRRPAAGWRRRSAEASSRAAASRAAASPLRVPAADDWGAPSSVGNPPEGGF